MTIYFDKNHRIFFLDLPWIKTRAPELIKDKAWSIITFAIVFYIFFLENKKLHSGIYLLICTPNSKRNLSDTFFHRKWNINLPWSESRVHSTWWNVKKVFKKKQPVFFLFFPLFYLSLFLSFLTLFLRYLHIKLHEIRLLICLCRSYFFFLPYSHIHSRSYDEKSAEQKRFSSFFFIMSKYSSKIKGTNASQYIIYFFKCNQKTKKNRNNKHICTLKGNKNFVFLFSSILRFLVHDKMMEIFHVVLMLNYFQQQQLRLLQLRQQKMNLDASMDMMDKLMDEMSAVDNKRM